MGNSKIHHGAGLCEGVSDGRTAADSDGISRYGAADSPVLSVQHSICFIRAQLWRAPFLEKEFSFKRHHAYNHRQSESRQFVSLLRCPADQTYSGCLSGGILKGDEIFKNMQQNILLGMISSRTVVMLNHMVGSKIRPKVSKSDSILQRNNMVVNIAFKGISVEHSFHFISKNNYGNYI